VTLAEVLTGVANIRSTTELRIANDYTYRQIMHIGMVYLKDKFMVLGEVARALGAKDAGAKDVGAKRTPRKPPAPKPPRKKKGATALPSWYRKPFRVDPRTGRSRRTHHRVVDLDGPMSQLEPYLGKDKIRRPVGRGGR
jgi:hypothetical protein